MKVCVRAECRPLSRPSRNGELAETASSSGSTGRSRSQTRTARSMSADPDVHVQAEGVVAPGDVLQAVLDAVVVLGVDHRLLAVVGPRVGAGGAERGAVRLGEREQPPPALALARERVAAGRLPAPEMISISEEISSPAMCSRRHRHRRPASRSSSKRGASSSVSRIEDRELLLEPDGEVGGAAKISSRGQVELLIDRRDAERGLSVLRRAV